MPNWIEGTLKIRGTKENIEYFIKNGIDYNDYKYDLGNSDLKNGYLKTVAVPRVDCDIVSDKYDLSVKNVRDLHIKETRRMFINSDKIEGYWRDLDKEIIVIDIQQAWNFDNIELEKLSSKYNVDFYLFGTEKGMEFCQEVEVVDGKTTKNDCIEFDDFEWECPDPRLGG